MKKSFILTILLALLAATVLLVSRAGTRVQADDYDTKRAAYDRMQSCMDAVKHYKDERSLALSEEDRFATGMIGLEWSGISTTLGALDAKRTTANADMAALMVQMLSEAGLQAGDTVGVGASGSFPALNIAVISACNEMDIHTIVIPSVGSSAYGANEPELPFPAMLALLMKDGLLTCDVPFFTPGGDYDIGQEMEEAARDLAEETVSALGLSVVKEADFATNLSMRMDAYGDIACFIGVGGNLTTLGKNADTLPRGVIAPSETLRPVNENSGLLERYHAQGMPVIHLLNIKEIVADYNLAFDPQTLPARGESAVFYQTRYPKLPVVIALLVTVVIAFWIQNLQKKI